MVERMSSVAPLERDPAQKAVRLRLQISLDAAGDHLAGQRLRTVEVLCIQETLGALQPPRDVGVWSTASKEIQGRRHGLRPHEPEEEGEIEVVPPPEEEAGAQADGCADEARGHIAPMP